MKAVVFNGVGDDSVQNVADPAIQDPNDIIVKLTCCAICGTDLHFVRGSFGAKEKTRKRTRRTRERMMEQPPAPERHEDEMISGGSPAQERARRAEHEDEEREQKERVRREQENPPKP